MEAATPHNPLSFVFGNTLSVLIPLMALGGARRIFFFGADGIKPDWKSPAKHVGENDPEYRFDFDERDLDALTSGLRADTIDLDEAVEMRPSQSRKSIRLRAPSDLQCFARQRGYSISQIGFTEAQKLLNRAD